VTFDLTSYIDKMGRLVDNALAESLPSAGGPANDVVEAMRYSLFAGGKRLRPLLCLAGAEAVGASPETAIPGAVALEMIHTYSLIHDDLPAMDDDDLRRGRPACHKAFGEATAVLAGDGLLTRAFGVLAEAGENGQVPSDRALQALSVLARAAGHEGMVGGQEVDIKSEGRDVSAEVVDYIHLHKTAALIRAAVVIGAVLGGGDEGRIAALDDYGRNVGLAFQIIDDILDIEGESGALGKTVGSDQARGKATYPAVHGVEASRQYAAKLLSEAVDRLEEFIKDAEPLKAIAEYLLHRKT
jgi:geranylgeranyl diphosphate synthase type II